MEKIRVKIPSHKPLTTVYPVKQDVHTTSPVFGQEVPNAPVPLGQEHAFT